MKTDDLINRLSNEAGKETRLNPVGTVAFAVAAACLIVISGSFLIFGVREELLQTIFSADHELIVKMLFAVSIIAGALFAVIDLSIPSRGQRLPTALMIAPFIVMGVTAVHELSSFSIESWPKHIGHTSSWSCLWQITLLAVPAFMLLAFAVKRLAPTNLRRVGFFIGLLSGGVGVLAYVLHAPGESIPFGTVYYSVAIVLFAIAGAILGPRMLRWS